MALSYAQQRPAGLWNRPAAGQVAAACSTSSIAVRMHHSSGLLGAAMRSSALCVSAPHVSPQDTAAPALSWPQGPLLHSRRSGHAAAGVAGRGQHWAPVQPLRQPARQVAASSASAAMAMPMPGSPSQQQQQQQEQAPQQEKKEENINNLPPLQADRKGFQMPPSAPLTWGFMITYLTFMLVVPIIALLSKAATTPADVFISRAFEPVAMHAYFVSFSCAIAAAAINAVFGFLLAWVLVKYDFPGRKWIDAAVDLPFALPTSVAGLTLATVYSDETILGRAMEAAGLPVVFTRLGVALAMVFVSFPFVVRTMQPVIQEMQAEIEEAAWTLGASPWKTFTEVLLPPLLPPLLTGTALAFSRALGEFGSIVIISSNFAFKDLIAPVLIFQCLEQYDFMGATIIGTVLLGISLCIMLLVNWIQTFGSRFRNK